MAAVGRPLESVQINGREFQCVGDAAGTRKRGGYENEWQPNGNQKTGRKVMTPVGWSVAGQNLAIDDAQKDQEYIQAVCDSPEPADFVFNYGQGIRYQGTGTLVDVLEYDPMTATMGTSFMGGGQLTQL
jgi:hypothetical protein